MLGALIVLSIGGLIFYFFTQIDSDNEVKSRIGCFLAVVIGIAFTILSVIGTFKSCTSMFSDGSSRDYYDAPRK